jgi:CBS domain-containing protein
LTEQDLLKLAVSGRVIFHESEEYIFRKSQPRGTAIWVIQQGSVEIIDETLQGEQLQDMLGEGDLLGSDRFLGSAVHRYSAKTASDVILYSIDTSTFEEVVAHNPRVARYLAAHFSITERHAEDVRSAAIEMTYGKAADNATWIDAPGPPYDFLQRYLLAAGPEVSIREAALKMRSANRYWIAVVDTDARPLGLVTDSDLRDEVATGKVSSDAGIDLIMNTHLPCAPPELSAVSYFLQMMQSRKRELLITADGGTKSPLQGVVTDSGLSLFTGRNPLLIALQMLEAHTVADWKRLLQQAEGIIIDGLRDPSKVDICARIVTEFSNVTIESMIRRAQVELADTGVPAPRIPHCWLLFGRAGRGEAVVFTHPEVGVVYEDLPSLDDPAVDEYFATVIQKTHTYLAECGLRASSELPDENGASRCHSLADWQQFFEACIADPIGKAVHVNRTLFDFQPLFGESGLAQELKRTIVSGLQEEGPFIPIIANDTLSNLPPLTFFRGLVIELDGAQRDTLDVEKMALDPITDAARVFAFATRNLDDTNTLERLAHLASALPESAPIFEEAAQAFRVAAYQRALAAFHGEGGGAIIRPSILSKFDQRLLKTAFDSIQRLLELSSTAFDKAA